MNKSTVGFLFGIFAGFLWSFTFLAPKIAHQFSSTEILLGRYIFFFIISLFFFSFKKTLLFLKQNSTYLKEALIITISGFSGYYFLLIGAVKLIGVPFTSFTMGMVPVTMILFAGDFTKSIKVFWPSILCITSGLFILLIDSSGSGAGTINERFAGALLAFASLASWTFYAFRNKRFLEKHPEVKNKEWASVLGFLSLPTVILFLIIESSYETKTFLILEAGATEIWTFIACSIAIGIGSSWLATVCWNIAGSILSPQMLGQIVVSETCFAIIINSLYEERYLSSSEIAAVILLLFGVLLTAKKQSISV